MKSNYINYMPQEYLRSYGTNIIFEEIILVIKLVS